MHLRSSYTEQLDKLAEQRAQLAKGALSLLERACEAAQTGRGEEPAHIERTSSEIAELERDVETTALRLLLLQQPVAIDLREVTGALKTATDLKRIGELSLDVFRSVEDMQEKTFDIQQGDLAEMSNATTEMVGLACAAYDERDLDRAAEAAHAGEAVYEYMYKVRGHVVQAIYEGTIDADNGVSLLMIAKCLERIAGHAKSISRWAGYIVNGEVPA